MIKIDISKLPKVDRTRPRYKVIDLGSGSAPKFVTVEAPTPDAGRIYARYTGSPPGLAVNDYVMLLFTDSDTFPVIVGTSAGTLHTGGGGWPFNNADGADDIITVHPSDTNADYATLAAAISAATAGCTILFSGTHTITVSSLVLNKAITLQGINPETSIITSTLSFATLDVSAAATLRDFKVTNTGTNASNHAIHFNKAILAENVVAETTGAGSGGNNAGWRQTGGSGAILRNCKGTGSGNATNNYGFLADTGTSSTTIEGGKYDGQADGTFEADIASTVTGSAITLVNPQFANNRLRITGTVTGSAIDSYGRDAGFLVKNSSGNQMDAGRVGYIDVTGSYNETTTEADTVKWVVVTVGNAAVNKYAFVKNEGVAVVNYTGSTPGTGDLLTTSTTAGSAVARLTMHPGVFAQCVADGSGGTVKVLLRAKSETIDFFSSNPYFQGPVLFGPSDWNGTINGAPSGSTLVYTDVSGDENWLDMFSTSTIAKIIVHNTSIGDSLIVSDTNVSTNTITFTTAVPGSWLSGHTITIRSQTNTDVSGSAYFMDFWVDTSQIPLLSRAIILDFHWFDTSVMGVRCSVHPYETFSSSKALFLNANTNTILTRTLRMPLINSRFTIRAASSGSGTGLLNLYSMGYVLAGV